MDINLSGAVHAMSEMFSQIGYTGRSKKPYDSGNRDVTAWEVMAADTLYRLAIARRYRARAKAVKEGIMFDHKKHPMEPGPTQECYRDDNIAMMITVSPPQLRFNEKALRAALAAEKLEADAIERIVADAMQPIAAAHSFEAVTAETTLEDYRRDYKPRTYE